jgi:hypothetical protein
VPPGPDAGTETARGGDAPPAGGAEGPGDAGTGPDGIETVTTDPVVPGTQPATADAAPAARPAAALALEEFRKLEAEFEAASKQPVVEQPLDRLTEGYTKLVGDGNLTGQKKRIAEARLMALGMRADARGQLEAFRKSKAEMAERTRELEAEQQEIKQRLEQTKVTLYSAVGVLRVSSLQQGPTTLYRLTDPGTGRTVVYLRSNDAKLPGLLNQFVGVRGEVTSDARLKLKSIAPTVAEVVDQSKVNKSVIATITPPSMIPQIAGTEAGEPAVAD